MVKPTDQSFITLADLLKRLFLVIMLAQSFITLIYSCSGQGDTIVNILTDLNGFLNYENREFLLAEEQEGSFV